MEKFGIDGMSMTAEYDALTPAKNKKEALKITNQVMEDSGAEFKLIRIEELTKSQLAEYMAEGLTWLSEEQKRKETKEKN